MVRTCRHSSDNKEVLSRGHKTLHHAKEKGLRRKETR